MRFIKLNFQNFTNIGSSCIVWVMFQARTLVQHWILPLKCNKLDSPVSLNLVYKTIPIYGTHLK